MSKRMSRREMRQAGLLKPKPAPGPDVESVEDDGATPEPSSSTPDGVDETQLDENNAGEEAFPSEEASTSELDAVAEDQDLEASEQASEPAEHDATEPVAESDESDSGAAQGVADESEGISERSDEGSAEEGVVDNGTGDSLSDDAVESADQDGDSSADDSGDSAHADGIESEDIEATAQHDVLGRTGGVDESDDGVDEAEVPERTSVFDRFSAAESRSADGAEEDDAPASPFAPVATEQADGDSTSALTGDDVSAEHQDEDFAGALRAKLKDKPPVQEAETSPVVQVEDEEEEVPTSKWKTILLFLILIVVGFGVGILLGSLLFSGGGSSALALTSYYYPGAL